MSEWKELTPERAEAITKGRHFVLGFMVLLSVGYIIINL